MRPLERRTPSPCFAAPGALLRRFYELNEGSTLASSYTCCSSRLCVPPTHTRAHTRAHPFGPCLDSTCVDSTLLQTAALAPGLHCARWRVTTGAHLHAARLPPRRTSGPMAGAAGGCHIPAAARLRLPVTAPPAPSAASLRSWRPALVCLFEKCCAPDRLRTAPFCETPYSRDTPSAMHAPEKQIKELCLTGRSAH